MIVEAKNQKTLHVYIHVVIKCDYTLIYMYIKCLLFSFPFSSSLSLLSLSLSLSLQVHNKYTADDFDDDLRTVLRRADCRDEKIVFIMDESNVLDSGFLERINTLLANGEVRRERERKEEEKESECVKNDCGYYRGKMGHFWGPNFRF